ncbi:hypothetical protein AVEN_172168-1 [Araneus ventricosus]|uniref:Uncharacterized protein n=1 Tax=Araneus ventricosus TaxID=182803 RepID=A0A4Y2JHT1_ARAVE|nr:hypothetical protein AVEN_172168-1 [Araneus ventricosus]
MTSTTPELAPPLQNSKLHQREDVWPLRMIWRAAGPIHGGSSVEMGLEPGTLLPQSRDLTTRPPGPDGKMEFQRLPDSCEVVQSTETNRRD